MSVTSDTSDTHPPNEIPTVDFDKSVKIIEEILSHFDDEDQIIINEGMDLDGIYATEEAKNMMDKVLNYRHKLRITTLQVVDTLQSVRNLRVSDIEDTEFSKTIEIYSDSSFDEKKKELSATMFMHNTSAECDISFPTFEYIDEIKAWVIMGDFWGAPNGIHSGDIMMLDFSDY